MRIGILTSHPIQYQAPWFRALARKADVKVFFAHRQTPEEQGRAGFGVAFEWDVDLLSGYEHQFLKNVSSNPGTGTFRGCDTPEIIEIIRATTQTDRESFDAFIVNGWQLKCYRQAAKACRAAGIPVLVRGDSHLQTPRSWAKRLAMEFTHRWLLKKFDGFLTVGQRNREYLVHFGARSDRIFFVPHFVDNDWFSVKAASDSGLSRELRKSWGADEGTIVVLFVGKFQEVKRPQDILRALAKFALESPLNKKYRLLAVFVGGGVLEDALRAEAKELSVNLHFAGFKNQGELPACYAAADILVLPSVSETWGLVVNEAMACGLPAIVSDAVGCHPDLIENGHTGFVFPVGNTDALAAIISDFLKLRVGCHDFLPALKEKSKSYSVATAVEGTILAVAKVRM